LSLIGTLPYIAITGDTLTASNFNNDFNAIRDVVDGSIDSTNIGTLATTLTFSSSTNVDSLDIVKAGTGAGSVIDASDAGTGVMVDLQKTGIGTVLLINQDAEALSIDIDSEATSADIINIQGTTLTTGRAIDIPDLNALTSGRALNIYSNSSSSTARELVHIESDHASATGVDGLVITLDAGGYAILIGNN